MTAIENRTARADLWLIVADHYRDGAEADEMLNAFKVEVLTEALADIGVLFDDPDTDNDTVRACHEALLKRVDATKAGEITGDAAVTP